MTVSPYCFLQILSSGGNLLESCNRWYNLRDDLIKSPGEPKGEELEEEEKASGSLTTWAQGESQIVLCRQGSLESQRLGPTEIQTIKTEQLRVSLVQGSQQPRGWVGGMGWVGRAGGCPLSVFLFDFRSFLQRLLVKGWPVVIEIQSKGGPAWCRTEIKQLWTIQRLIVSLRTKIAERLITSLAGWWVFH